MPDASATGSVGGAFQVATAAQSSSIITSSSAVIGIIPVSSGRIAPGSFSLAGNAGVDSWRGLSCGCCPDAARCIPRTSS